MPDMQNGYTQHHVPVYSIDPSSGEEHVVVQDCSVWIGALDNEAFGGSRTPRKSKGVELADPPVGHEELNVLAKRIYDCHGPSRPNRVSLVRSLGDGGERTA